MEILTGEWPLPIAVAVLGVSAAVIGIAGTRLVTVADQLADRTGLVGLIHRERQGPAGIGVESAALIVVFVVGYGWLLMG